MSHSEYYVNNCSASQFAGYFREVVLNSEYKKGRGNDKVVQKWKREIKFCFNNATTFEEKETICSLMNELSQVKGFPQAVEEKNMDKANFRIFFLSKQDLNQTIGRYINYEDCNGASIVSFDNMTNEILNVNIYYNKDMDKDLNQTVIKEEIINSIGLGNDTETRSDSIIYQYLPKPDKLSDIDWAIIKVLYSDEIRCGMDYINCEEVINRIYY